MLHIRLQKLGTSRVATIATGNITSARTAIGLGLLRVQVTDPFAGACLLLNYVERHRQQRLVTVRVHH